MRGILQHSKFLKRGGRSGAIGAVLAAIIYTSLVAWFLRGGGFEALQAYGDGSAPYVVLVVVNAALGLLIGRWWVAALPLVMWLLWPWHNLPDEHGSYFLLLFLIAETAIGVGFAPRLFMYLWRGTAPDR